MKKRNLLIITHPVNLIINPDDCISAVEEIKGKNFYKTIQCVEFNKYYVDLSNNYDLDFESLFDYQEQKFKDYILPIINDNSIYDVAYFGMAPVALSFHLGSLFNNFHNFDIYQFNREEEDSQNSKWLLDGNGSIQANVIQAPISKAKFRVGGDAVIHYSTSFPADIQASSVATDGLTISKSFDLGVSNHEKTLIFKQADIRKLRIAFQSSLDYLKKSYPNLNTVHLFLATQSGIPYIRNCREF